MQGLIQRRHWLARMVALPWMPWPVAALAQGAIVFGQSAPISGAGQHFGIEYARGLKLFFDATNANGGVNGRRIELITYDDQYEVETAALNTQDLLLSDKVFALVGYVGSEMSMRALALPSAAGVPFIAPLSGADALRGPNFPNVVNFRASHGAEIKALLRQVSTVGVRRVSVLVQNDADGKGLLAALQPALASSQISSVGEAWLDRNSKVQVELALKDVKTAVAQLISQKPEAILLLTAHSAAAQTIREARQAGFKGTFYATSLGSAAALAQLLGDLGEGVVATQVVPLPTDLRRAMVARYCAHIGSSPPDHTSLEGWLVGSMVVEALRRCGKVVTRERFLNALLAMENLDLGGFHLAMQSKSRQASNFVDIVSLGARGRLRS